MKNNKKRWIVILLGIICLGFGLSERVKAADAKEQIIYQENDTWEKAVELPQCIAVTGNISKEHMDQYYMFDLDKTGLYLFDFRGYADNWEGEGEGPVVYLYNGRKELLCRDTIYTGLMSSPEECLFGVFNRCNILLGDHIRLHPGRYYIRVSGKTYDAVGGDGDEVYGKYWLYMCEAEPDADMKLSKDEAIYTGKKIKLPSVTLRDAEGKKIDPSLYQVTVENCRTGKQVKFLKQIGAYRISVKFKSRYTKQLERYFLVRPSRIRSVRVTNPEKGSIQVSTKSNKAYDEYEIEISTDKKFRKGCMRYKVKNGRKKISNLKSGKKYYIRMRRGKWRKLKGEKYDFELVDGRYCESNDMLLISNFTINSDWSRVQSIVCK